MLENSIGKADEVDGKVEQVILQKGVLTVVWDGRGGGICAQGVHIHSLRGCNEYVVGDAVFGPVGEVVEFCLQCFGVYERRAEGVDGALVKSDG